MKLHRSRRAAGLALLLALPLPACSTPGAEPGVAARVGDRTVAEKDVETATTELAAMGFGRQFDAGAVTNYLALGPLLVSLQPVNNCANDGRPPLGHGVGACGAGGTRERGVHHSHGPPHETSPEGTTRRPHL